MNLFSNIKKVFSRKAKSSLIHNTLSLIPYTLSLILAAMLPSCSEDLDVSDGIEGVPEGYMQINIAVPDPTIVSTRSGIDESIVNTLKVFIFSQDGMSKLQEVDEFTSLSGNSVSFSLNGNARDKDVLIYAVANVSGITGINSSDDLRKYTLTPVLAYIDNSDNIKANNFSNGLPMVGYSSVNTSDGNNVTVPIYRAVAKISAVSSVAEVSVSKIWIYKYSDGGFLSSYLNKEDFDNNVNTYQGHIIDSNGLASIELVSNEGTYSYVYPSKGVGSKTDLNNGAFVVVEVIRNGKNQYYRLNLRKTKANSDDLEFIDLYANHEYKINITGFFTDGYDTYSEAAKHPDCDSALKYEIHDHAAEVLSMITDGYNELGVTPEINLNSSKTSATVVVKCFNPDNDNVQNSDISFTTASSWLSVSYSKVHNTATTQVDDFNEDWDSDNHGNQYEYIISIKEGQLPYEDQVGEVVFTWNNLKRTVKVNYEAAFNLPDVCEASLTIYEDGVETEDKKFSEIKDYWTFIRSLGENKSTTNGVEVGALETPKLWGILAEDMTGEKKRTNGFHFPMPYGENHSSTPWTYVYSIDFKNLLNQSDVNATSIQRIDAVIDGDDNLKAADVINWEYNTSRTDGKLRFDQSKLSNPYDYLGGTLTFTITYNNNSTSEIVASLYHTGFFHYEGNDKYAPTEYKGYYYYEVVPMGAEGDYWLDRNICARSNKSFIDISNDPNDDTDRSAAGFHYTIIENQKDFELPDWDFNMCPPGYHVPNTTEWDNVRLSRNFQTRSVIYNNTTFMSTYYVTNNSKIGNIYLQKARFVNSQNIWNSEGKRFSPVYNKGDAGAGYYWSVTEAPAMEKEQMGNWLRALYLNGSSTTYNNASIIDHRMPIRCKAGTATEATSTSDYYISFNVHEATHVYFFNVETQTPLYTFPGRAIGSASSSIKWQHFYCSTAVDPSKLRMLFVKLDKDDGSVYIYRKPDSGYTNDEGQAVNFVKTREYNKNYLSEAYSWAVENGKYYDFCEKRQIHSDNITDNVLTSEPKDCTTSQDSDNTGGDSGQLKGNQVWKGSLSINWSVAFEEWAYDKYDWSSLKENSTLTIYYNYGNYYDVQLRVWHATPNWNEIPGLPNTYASWSTPALPQSGKLEITLTRSILTDLINNGGLAITGNGYTLTQVEVKNAD